jgi:hypothetical protein
MVSSCRAGECPQPCHLQRAFRRLARFPRQSSTLATAADDKLRHVYDPAGGQGSLLRPIATTTWMPETLELSMRRLRGEFLSVLRSRGSERGVDGGASNAPPRNRCVAKAMGVRPDHVQRIKSVPRASTPAHLQTSSVERRMARGRGTRGQRASFTRITSWSLSRTLGTQSRCYVNSCYDTSYIHVQLAGQA